jgi:hypothetical protein
MEVFVSDSVHTADVLGASPCYRHLSYDSYERDEQGILHMKYDEPEHPFDIWCVEVKVSRADYLNGYAEKGCNKHYVLAPREMIAPSELPKHVGLVEYDERVRPAIHNGYPIPTVPCLKVKKKCQKQIIDDKAILKHIGRMGDMATTNMTRLILDKCKDLWVLTPDEMRQLAIREEAKGSEALLS